MTAPVTALAAWLILAAPAAEIEVEGEPTEEDLRSFRKLSAEPGGYARVLITGAFGRGFRFNNPFRLETQLGKTERSLSLTAPYHDVGLGLLFGEPDGIQHGGALRLSIALEGVEQQALGVSYLIAYRDPDLPVLGYGRLGLSILTAPDPNVGGELAGGVAAFFTGGFGVHAELVGNLFYGAGSLEAQYTVVPVLSLQGGIITELEVLP
jgi:hypothetical protein